MSPPSAAKEVVRTRFAPSPTGFLHIGGARTALFNLLFARHHGGTFLLRIDDTDQERSTAEAVSAILDGLRWLRLDWDEGPYRQSERSEHYREQAERLLRAGKAYWCACTIEELEAKRKAAQAEGRKSMYDRTCRDAGHQPGSRPLVLRFKVPSDGETAFTDLIKGRIAFQNRELDDLILLRSNGTPTFNFCGAVDDALLKITHIIRGEDHISNTPKQIQILDALGFPIPHFAHVPLILGLDRARLSKRHGATSVTAYREEGFLPDALVNYLVRLGWAHGDQELFARDELIEKFSLEGVGTAAGVFNPEKLLWVNFSYLKALPPEQLAQAIRPFVEAKGYEVPSDGAWLEAMARTLQERAKTLVELVDSAHFYFADEITIDEAAAKKHLRPANAEALRAVRQGLEALTDWSETTIQAVFDDVVKRFGLGLGKIAQPVRVALTGGTVSPGIFEVIAVLGRERTLRRLDRAFEMVQPGGAQAPLPQG